MYSLHAQDASVSKMNECMNQSHLLILSTETSLT